jgi:hypothetical protein
MREYGIEFDDKAKQELCPRQDDLGPRELERFKAVNAAYSSRHMN